MLLQIYVCRSGSAADTQAIASYLQYYLAQHQMELDNEIQVKTAAAFATRLVYSNKVWYPAQLSANMGSKHKGNPLPDNRHNWTEPGCCIIAPVLEP